MTTEITCKFNKIISQHILLIWQWISQSVIIIHACFDQMVAPKAKLFELQYLIIIVYGVYFSFKQALET